MRPTAERGFVLVCVLWVLAILTVITLGFGRRAMLDRRAATYALDHTKAMAMARGAVERGVVELRNKAVMDALSHLEARTSFRQPWAKPVNMLEKENYFDDANKEEFEDDICEYRIRDECGLISINRAPDEILEEVDALNRTTIRKINARRLGDRNARQDPQPFQTIEELRFFDGIDEDDWFGTDRTPGLRAQLTCWGDERININTATAAVLECIPELRKRTIDALIDYRMGPDGELCTSDDGDFKDLDEVRVELGLGADSLQTLRQYCKVDSGLFTITGTATRRQGKVRATCVATVAIGGSNAVIIKWREEFLDP